MSEFSINLPPRLPTAGPAPNVLTAVIPDPPRQLSQLDNGTIIKGQVQGRDPDGMLVVVTDKGALKLSTAANLPTGSQVTMEVRNAGDRLQVLVLSVDGQPIGSAGGQGPRTGGVPPSTAPGSQAPSPATGAAPPASVAIVGSVLQGTIVQTAPDTLAQLIRSLLPGPAAAAPTIPAATGTATSSTAGQAAPGTLTASADSLPKALVNSLQSDVRAKIESLFFSTPVAKGGLATAGPGQTAGAAVPGAAGSAQNLKLPIPLATGAEVRLRLIAVSPAPGHPIAIPASASRGQHVMAGRIIGYTPAGNAVLQSPMGAIILQGSLSLPVGTELSAAVEPMLPAPTTAIPSGTLPLSQLLLSIARGWPSLADAIGLLRQGSSDADALAALWRLPQVGPKLAAGLVAAMQAIGANDVEGLLGALVASRSGSAGRDDAARKLRQEFAQVSTLAQERAGIDWRCCFIPILDDGTI
ncbi:MAG: hypothetical protein ACREEP_16040, partial [Dongiaceae bacterium]